MENLCDIRVVEAKNIITPPWKICDVKHVIKTLKMKKLEIHMDTVMNCFNMEVQIFN